MPSKNMLPKGQRHRSVRAEYRATRGVEEPGPPVIPRLELDPYAPGAQEATHSVVAPAEARGMRLDQYLAQAIPEISRSRVQLLVEGGQVLINGAPAPSKHKVTPGERIAIAGSPRPAPLKAAAEDIPLAVVYEDEFLVIVDKPAGMSVHAGNAAPVVEAREEAAGDEVGGEEETVAKDTDPRSAGTLVNALMHHFAGELSSMGGELRPGIVHRLDKGTSGLILVAKDDRTHAKLSEAFAERTVHKTYLALVQGHVRKEETTVTLPIGRDLIRRTRMTTRRPIEATGVRSAISHVHVLERLQTAFGPFTRVEVTIETGRTHQIRVHLQALGHPVVGDTVYGAAAVLRAVTVPRAVTMPRALGERTSGEPRVLQLQRNFLHAARLELAHPRTGKPLVAEAPLPAELVRFLEELRAELPAPAQASGESQ